MSRLLNDLLSLSPAAAALDCPLILRVGTSFPCTRVMEVVGDETADLKPEGEEMVRLLSRRRVTSRARQRASLPCSAERRSSTNSLRAATSSGEERDCEAFVESKTKSLFILHMGDFFFDKY